MEIQLGLVSLPCAVLILSKPITLPIASVTFAVVLSPGFHHTPSVRLSLPALCFLLGAGLLITPIAVTSLGLSSSLSL